MAALTALLGERTDLRAFVEFATPAAAGTEGTPFSAMSIFPCPVFTRLVAAQGSTLWAGGGNSSLRALDVLEPNACRYVPYYPTPAGAPFQTHLALAKGAENTPGLVAARFTVGSTFA